MLPQLAAARIPLIETYFYDPANTPTLELNERAKTESWVRKLSDGRYRVRQVGQHCYLGEGRGLQRNRNGRRYPADKTWGRHTVRESAFMQRVSARRVIGQVEHPDSGRNDLSLAAMLIAEVSEPCPTTGKVFVEWETLSTPGGRILASLIEDRVGFGLSSRGNGSVVRVDGVDEVQEDFEPVTFDAVADESTPGAELAATAIREGIERALADAGGDLNEAIKRDREAAAHAVQRLVECIGHGGSPAACVQAHIGPVSTRRQPLGEAGKVLAESGDYRARAYPTALGGVDIVLEGTNGSRLVEMGLDSMHAAQQRAMHHVAQALQALATGAQDDPAAQMSAPPSAGNNPHEPMTMPVGGEWILGTREGEGHYRTFEKGPGNHQVWYVGHNTAPVLVGSGLRTVKDAKAAAENHLHTVVGEDAMNTNEAEITGAQPYAGNAVEIRFDSSEQCKKACRAIKKAGFRYEEDGDTVVVQAENPDAAAVMDQLKRVLDGAGIELEENIEEMGMDRTDMMGRGSMDHMDGAYDDDPEPGVEWDQMPYDLSYMDMDDEDEEEEDDDEDMMLGYLPEPDYMEAAMDAEPFVGDPEVGLDPTDDEEDAPSPYDSEYAGQDPEDLDLDLDVNEADGYGQPGKERKNAVAGASTSAKAGGEMGGARRKNSDLEKTGGSVDSEKKGGGGEMSPSQRKAKEGGSALPDKGKGGRGGQSMPQKAAKMVEAIPRALADLRTAWANGDGQTAAKVSGFLESVGRAVSAGLRERASDSPRVRFLQNEVARLESENTHLRALNEAMTEVQRTEVLEFERKLIIRDHPELGEAEDTLKRCDTLDEMHAEKDRLLRLVGSSARAEPPVAEGKGKKKDKMDDEDDDACESINKNKAPDAPSGFQMVREGKQGAVNSLSVEGAPTKPLDESMVDSAGGAVPQRAARADTASRVVAARRRRRRG